jgi:hypothetical protein
VSVLGVVEIVLLASQPDPVAATFVYVTVAAV